MANVRMRVSVPQDVARRFKEEFAGPERQKALLEGIKLVLEKRSSALDREALISDYKLRASEGDRDSKLWDATLLDGIEESED